jgi:arylsulfatase A-like enzyme
MSKSSTQSSALRSGGNASRPNILYIMSDDHSANAVSMYGSILASVFQTPHIDRLGNEGIRLNNFFSTNALCTPARANLMTGQYSHTNGVRTLEDAWHPENSGPNLAKLLQQAGYRTAIFGKWHLLCKPAGFDEYKYLSNVYQQGTYRDPEFMEKGRGVIRHSGHVTDIITEMCLQWLREDRDTERPFFLMCHHKAPHDLWEYQEKYEHLFDSVDMPVPDSLFEDRSHRSVASRDYGASVTPRSKVRNLYDWFLNPQYPTGPLLGTENMTFEEKGVAAYQKYLRDYLRTVAGIDDSVGVLLGELEKQGILDETIVIYTSDQGIFLGEHDYQDKRWSYEEALRSPFLVRYPREIEKGLVSDELMANVDIAPTLLDYAGIEAPPSMQGISMRNTLAGGSGGRNEIYFRYWMHRAHRMDNPAHFGIRTADYKLIFYYGLPLDASGALAERTPPGWELYDLRKDPSEMNNVYCDPHYAQIVVDLKERLFTVKRELGDDDVSYPEIAERLRLAERECE